MNEAVDHCLITILDREKISSSQPMICVRNMKYSSNANSNIIYRDLFKCQVTVLNINERKCFFFCFFLFFGFFFFFFFFVFWFFCIFVTVLDKPLII